MEGFSRSKFKAKPLKFISTAVMDCMEIKDFSGKIKK
jgi:hypothetical protein